MRTDLTDTYHGTSVADPYRWLEDDVRESPAVAGWVERENSRTRAYLDTIPARNRIAQRLRELWNYERYGLPVHKAGRYFYSYNDGLQNQDVLYMLPSLAASPHLLVDPNTWSGDGTMALASWQPSADGHYVAFQVQDGGSDWHSARVLDAVTGRELADRLEWLKFTGLSWAKDGSGFYYSRYPRPAGDALFQSLNTGQAVYFHRLGEEQARDTLVYENREHPDWGYAAQVTDDGHYLVITVWKGTDNRYQVLVQNLRGDGTRPYLLIGGFDFDYTFVGSTGNTLYFRTTNAAPRGRLIAINLAEPEPERWREIIPQARDVLTQVTHVGGRFVAARMQDARSVVDVYALDGRFERHIDLPGIGSATGFSGDAADPATFYRYESFDTAPVIRMLNVTTGTSTGFRRARVDFDSDDFVVEQEFFTSKDGTRVPMFIVRHKSVQRDGGNPAILYGYGGFNVSLTPDFSVTRLAWLELGGIWAVANLRGGGEYGEEWHKAGTKLDKQNVFDDFIAAGEYLVERRYTNSSKLAIFGGSNGGLLVGAVLNQRPGLFAAALPDVGVMDMLRFHKFTAGRFWVDDYGSADDPQEFRALLAYSPYHNVRAGARYPAVLVTTADTDDRVVPAHSFKYAAAMQAAQAGTAPILIRIESRAGHGAGTPTDKAILACADRWAFLLRNLDMHLPECYAPDTEKQT